MGYRIKVIIPRDYLLVYMNVVSEADIAQYEECIAFALSDRWQIDELEFEIQEEVDGHSFICEGGDLLTAKPTEIEFSVALQEAIANYRYFKSGYPPLSPGTQHTYVPGAFTPIPSWLSDPVEPPEEESARSYSKLNVLIRSPYLIPND
jgi:hypothetical protein